MYMYVYCIHRIQSSVSSIVLQSLHSFFGCWSWDKHLFQNLLYARPCLCQLHQRQNQTISRLAKSKKDRVEKCYLTCLTTTFHNYEPAKKYQTVRYEPTWGTDARKIPLQSHLPDIGPRSSPTLRGRTPRTNRFPVDFTLSGAVGARKFPLHQETNNSYIYIYIY